MKIFTAEETRAFVSGLNRRPHGTNLLIEDERGRLLVLKHTYEASWGLPGGWIEHGESPRAAVIREVKEELGLSLASNLIEQKYMLDMTVDPVGEITVSVFKLDGFINSAQELTLQEIEISEVDWVERGAVLSNNGGREYILAIRLWAESSQSVYHEAR